VTVYRDSSPEYTVNAGGERRQVYFKQFRIGFINMPVAFIYSLRGSVFDPYLAKLAFELTIEPDAHQRWRSGYCRTYGRLRMIGDRVTPGLSNRAEIDKS
jgi:hypothetical protein